jgi:hypothetical protein
MRATASDWAERVRAWRDSGQSALEFARGKGFSDKSLRWWAGEFARRSVRGPAVTMARVVQRRDDEALAVTIAVGSVTIAVRRGFDPELLRAVIDALARGR